MRRLVPVTGTSNVDFGLTDWQRHFASGDERSKRVERMNAAPLAFTRKIQPRQGGVDSPVIKRQRQVWANVLRRSRLRGNEREVFLR